VDETAGTGLAGHVQQQEYAMTNPKMLGTAALSLILLGGWQAAGLATYNPPGTVRYSGSATVLRANVKVLTSNTRVVLADTGEIDTSGSTRDATVVTFDNPPPLEVHSKTAHAIAAGAGGVSSATAAVEKLVIKIGTLTISADVIESNSFAECNPDSATVAVNGNSTIVNLKINGRPIDASGPPNTKIVIPLVATIIINEQTQPDVNSIVVNAVHVIVPGVPGIAAADVVIARAASGILTCT
jgi:hypothetical protein